MDHSKLIDVDTASEDALQKLPGYGPKVAQSIIA
jgi:DNA uptake protein ComE-like DNA-binding protein